jgi:hypothetical protein
MRSGGDTCHPRVFHPFALSLSKGRSWFDKLTTNGVGHLGACQIPDLTELLEAEQVCLLSGASTGKDWERTSPREMHSYKGTFSTAC